MVQPWISTSALLPKASAAPQVQRDSAQQAQAVEGLAEGARCFSQQLHDTEALVAALQGRWLKIIPQTPLTSTRKHIPRAVPLPQDRHPDHACH